MAYLGNTTLSITTDTYLGNAREGIANNSLFGGVLLANNITTRELSDDAVLSNNIVDGAVTSNKLADTTVAAGTYGAGDGSQISVIVVDAKGRITTASNVATPVTSVAGATGAVSNAQVAAGFTSAIPPGTTGNVLTSTGTTWVSAEPPAGGGGSGLFNTSISEAVGYQVTTSMATAYTAPATAGKRYVIHSIHITNIGTGAEYSSVGISGQFSGSNYSNISFSDTVPVPEGSSVELLKKPKVLQPDDLIQLQASETTALHATITIEELDEDTYFGAGIDLTASATYTDLYTATANAVIESVLLSNDDAADLDVKASVVWTNGANDIQGYFSYDLIVPNDATVEVLEQPKFLPNGFKIRVEANQADRLEAIVAGKTV